MNKEEYETLERKARWQAWQDIKEKYAKDFESRVTYNLQDLCPGMTIEEIKALMETS